MLKKIFIVLLVLGSFQLRVHGQASTDQRTVTTKIADLLAQLPARDAKQLESNMLEIEQLGNEGFGTLISGLAGPGQGKNANLEYAIGGYSAYVSQAGKEAQRSQAVVAYCKALANSNDKQVKSFLITQIELVGKDDAVYCLQSYLNDEQLADPASRALVKINTAAARAALLAALPMAQGAAKLSVIEALGLSRNKAAAPALHPLINSNEPEISKVTLSALAHIADPASADLLAAAAAKSNYQYDQNGATAALLEYAGNLLKDGNGSLAANVVKQMHDDAKAAEQLHTRTAALNILYQADKAAGMRLLLDAMSDQHHAYRAAAIKFAAPDMNDANTGLWLSKLAKGDNETKAQIATMFGIANAKNALPALTKLMKHKDESLRLQAIQSASRIGGEAVIPNLYDVMRKGDTTTIQAVSDALLRMEGKGIPATLASYLSKAKPDVQVALLNVIAARGGSDQIDLIYTYRLDKNPLTREAAYMALAHVATEKDVPQLFTFLKEQPAATFESVAIQDAIISAVEDSKSSGTQLDMVLQELGAAGAELKPAYYRILAALGGSKALTAVSAAYDSGDPASKKAAIEALGSWKDLASLPALLKISKTTADAQELNQALTGYLRLVRKAPFSAEQKFLKLSDAMSVAKTNEQRMMVLADLEQAKTFNAAVLAGKYLDDAVLKQRAANTVMSIILADSIYHGTIIRDLLTKTMNTLSGGDGEYQKQAIVRYLNEMPKAEGFVALFNGKDLTGWKGLVENPIKRAKMDAKTLAAAQAKADEQMLKGWKVEGGELRFQIHGDNLATVKKYGDFEMLVDWKIIDDKKQNGDAGIYLRGTPQVQIWDTARVKDGAQVGSGGLYNNQIHPSKPLKVADNALDEWNTFRILMKGDRVTVYLNGELVTDNVILENYWDRSLPIFAEEQIELQAHGSPVAYRNIYIRELPSVKPFELSAKEKKEGFKVLFDGTNMHEWIGNTTDYVIEDGNMAIRPKPGKGSGGNLFTKDQYSDFVFRFEFQLTPGANNGLGIRAPLEGDAAYEGMELQILDNDAPIYKDLHIYQYHGSIYGTIPAKRGFLKPTGEWNYEEVIVKGPKIQVILNGTKILDADITEARKNGAADGQPHPGLKRSTGHIGFLGHGSPVKFRNIRIKDLGKK
jgi:HEAT repeat protein